jgi:hypothetical protein
LNNYRHDEITTRTMGIKMGLEFSEKSGKSERVMEKGGGSGDISTLPPSGPNHLGTSTMELVQWLRPGRIWTEILVRLKRNLLLPAGPLTLLPS